MKPINQAYLEIDGSQVLCDSIGIDPEDGTDFVTAMTPNGEPLGVTYGNKRYKIAADCTMTDEEDVDFHQLWSDKENVPVEVQYQDGTTWAFNNGVFSKVALASKHGEKTTWSLEILCWGLQIS